MAARSVFISHSSKDDSLVRELRQSLESLGIEIWTDSEHLSGGDLLSPKIKSSIENADCFLPVITLKALNSVWVQKEIEHATSIRKPGYKIVPFVGSDIGLPILHLLFRKEPIAIRFAEGPTAVIHALPQLLAALGLQHPTETIQKVQAQTKPVADLVLELEDPSITDLNGDRRATAVAKLTYIPADEARSVQSARYRFTAPLGPIEAGELAWYLERYINWPRGIFEERANRVVEALPTWGQLLYKCISVPGTTEAIDAWKSATRTDRRFSVKVDKRLIDNRGPQQEIEAAAAATILLSLPWELLHDEKTYLFQGNHPVRVRRSLPNRFQQPALATKPPIRVLLVSPRPEDDSAVYWDHREATQPIVAALSKLGPLAEFKLLEPPTFPALENELTRAAAAGEGYHVIHFDGHGIYDVQSGVGMLCFEDPADFSKLERRRSKIVSADEIAQLVRDHRIPLFFLAACQTAKAGIDPGTSVAGRLLDSGVSSVAAMSHSVLVETARRFVAEFYKRLLSGERVGGAMLAGQRILKADTFRGESFTGQVHLHDWFVPVLFQEEQDPILIRDFPAEQVEEIIAKQSLIALGDLPEEPAHGFLGRSRDLLRAERLLAMERYLVVRGSGGEGKTTFAAELGRWLLLTRRFGRVAFTSVEQVTEVRQVLFSIGNQLSPNFASRVGVDDTLGLQLIERSLGEHKTLLVIDNVEAVLGGPQDLLEEILKLCSKLNRIGQTRLIFTSREALPSPFHRNALPISRLDRDTAIRLLGNLLPYEPDEGETEKDLEDLVDAVGGHARSLVLIAKEVGSTGVRHAVRNLCEAMRSIETKHPGQRENSLLASAELSLRRLPPAVRQMIRPLSVFHGGGGLMPIAKVLKLDRNTVVAVTHALVTVGLAEFIEPGYIRFDPGLFGIKLEDDEMRTAKAAWADAIVEEIQAIYEESFHDSGIANSLCLLELSNISAVLDYLSTHDSADRVIDVATYVESVISTLNRPWFLTKVINMREAAARKLLEWSHARYSDALASIYRLIQRGFVAEAVSDARALHRRYEEFVGSPYEGSDRDGAIAQYTLGRALQVSGDAEAALLNLEHARTRFEQLKDNHLVGSVLEQEAICLIRIGRYEDAANTLERSITVADALHDNASIVARKGHLATIRKNQGLFEEALTLYQEVADLAKAMNRQDHAAVIWHQIGMVYQAKRQFESAEQAYQKSLNIKVQLNDRANQAPTLNELGNLYSEINQPEDAVRLYRQALTIKIEFGARQSEGVTRSNIADELIKLRRYEEARSELQCAIECKRPFGHVAQPWKTFYILSQLERVVGDQGAALAARKEAMKTYFAYRYDGGAPETDSTLWVSIYAADPSGIGEEVLTNLDFDYRVAADIVLALELNQPTETHLGP